MKTNKIIIVDDHKIFREGLKLVLSTIPKTEVVGEASNGKEFLEIIKENSADIIFMDINMPEINGIKATAQAMETNPDLKIIAISSSDDAETINQSLYAGIHGYLLKNADYKEIEQAVYNLSEGKSYYSKQILEKLSASVINDYSKNKIKDKLSALTKRQKEILKLICSGYDTKTISEKLFISNRTVEKHKENLMNTTDTHSTAELIVYAHKITESN